MEIMYTEIILSLFLMLGFYVLFNQARVLLESTAAATNNQQAELFRMISLEQSACSALAAKLEEMTSRMTSLQATVSGLTGGIAKQTQKIQVAFAAKIRASTRQLVNEQILVFNDVISNIGHAYNASTGTFTCPVNGLYMFSATLVADPQGAALIQIRKDGVIVERQYSKTIPGNDKPGSDKATIRLMKGDEVILKWGGGNAVYIGNMSMFCGVLLKAD